MKPIAIEHVGVSLTLEVKGFDGVEPAGATPEFGYGQWRAQRFDSLGAGGCQGMDGAGQR